MMTHNIQKKIFITNVTALYHIKDSPIRPFLGFFRPFASSPHMMSRFEKKMIKSPFNPSACRGQVALITGGGSGIGFGMEKIIINFNNCLK